MNQKLKKGQNGGCQPLRSPRQVVLLMLFVSVLVIPFVADAATAAARVEIRVATAYAADNFQTANLQKYANDVATATHGDVKFTVYPAGSLLKPADIFSGVRADKAEAGEVIMSSLANEIPLFGVDSLPFIVRGYDDARRLWEASRVGVEKELDRRGLQLLYAVPWPPQNLYSNSQITTMKSFKGLRMRSYNPASERVAELILATSVPVQVINLEKAIASDQFDVMITSSWTGVESKSWSKMQYYYKVNAWIPKNIVFMSKKIFTRLDAETQRKLLDAAHNAEVRGWGLSQDSDTGFENQLIANKIHVSVLDPFIRSYLDRLGENLSREWLKKAGSEELSILLKYTTDRSMK